MQVIIEQSELDGIRVYGVTSTNESVKLEDTEALKPHIDALLAAVEALIDKELKEAKDTIKALIEQLSALLPTWEQGTYSKGARVIHNGAIYISQVGTNHWEPGAVGVHDNVWKKEA